MLDTIVSNVAAIERTEPPDTGPARSPGSREPSNLPALLRQARVLLQDLGDEFGGEHRRIDELSERLAQGRFHLAVLGQFKRGKSTLLNALIGEAVLPTSVVPLTAIPTFIRPGASRRARVHFQDQRAGEEIEARTARQLNEFLTTFVTEEGNPKNTLGVDVVEVFHPAEILSRNVVLIDTPGIGSTLRHNTEATLNFLPQCDAALFLVSADPPVTEVEVEFLKQVRTKVPRLFFILNKVDYLSPADRQVALEFLQKVLVDQAGIGRDVPVFCVSARNGLEARLTGDTLRWRQSGLAEVEHHLVEFLAGEKSQTLREAVGRKATDVVANVLMRLRLAIRSLQMPLDELQQRLQIFEQKLHEVRLQRQTASDLLVGDSKRMHQSLEEYADERRVMAQEYLEGVAQETLSRNGGKEADQDAIDNALAVAIPGYFEHQTGAATEKFRQRMADVLQPHQARADELIESIRRTAAELFDVPYRAPESSRAFEMVQQPYWVTHKWASRLSPIPPALIDRLLPAKTRLRRVHRRIVDQIGRLVVSNVENLRWATFQSIDQTFHRFGTALDQRLNATTSATHGAVRAAMERRQQQRELVSREVARLEEAVAELAEIQSALGGE